METKTQKQYLLQSIVYISNAIAFIEAGNESIEKDKNIIQAIVQLELASTNK